jgi:hypothetical protein
VEFENMPVSSFHIALALAGMSLLACSGGEPTTREPSAQEARRAIASLLDSMATSISNRDVEAIAARMPSDSSVVYVSDGRPIRGTELRTLLRDYYSGLRSLAFRWDSFELTPLGNQTWGATSWARFSVTDSMGNVTWSKAIFTWTVVYSRDRWVLARAHRTTLQ